MSDENPAHTVYPTIPGYTPDTPRYTLRRGRGNPSLPLKGERVLTRCGYAGIHPEDDTRLRRRCVAKAWLAVIRDELEAMEVPDPFGGARPATTSVHRHAGDVIGRDA